MVVRGWLTRRRLYAAEWVIFDEERANGEALLEGQIVVSTNVYSPETVVLWRWRRGGIGVEVCTNPVHEILWSTHPQGATLIEEHYDEVSFGILAGENSHRDTRISTEGREIDNRECCAHAIRSSSVLGWGYLGFSEKLAETV